MQPQIQQRNIALWIVLSIITCGICGIVWLYFIVEDVKTLTGDTEGMNGALVIILGIVTCNIYLLYWFYKTGQAIDDVAVKEGNASGSRGILYLLLSFFGLGIINYALIQNELNQRATVV